MIIIWSALLGAGAFAVIAATFFLWLKPLMNSKPTEAASPVEKRDEIRVVSKFPSPSSEEAINLVTRALANREPDQVGVLFRMGSAGVAEILDFCENSVTRDGVITGHHWLSSLDTGKVLIEGVLVSYDGTDGLVNRRLALLTPDSGGRWQLDFDSFARKVTPSWPEIMEKAPERATVRVMLAPDVYYNGPFSDESEWTAYVMSSPDIDTLIRGYCRKGSPVADELSSLFRDELPPARATLELECVPEAGDRQFEITGVLARDWILP